MKSIISHSIEETKEIAKRWLEDISHASRDNSSSDSGATTVNGAFVVGLCGHLGSGKTAFVQAVAEELGVKEHVTSPTFVIMKIYEIDQVRSKSPWKRLVHIDAYRLEKGEELGALDFEAVVANPHNLVLIEWAENVKSGLPEGWKRIDFETAAERERKIDFAL